MDIIGALSSQLSLPEGQAKGLAGSLLGLVKGAVAENVGEDAAKQMATAVPEAEEWERGAPQPAADTGGGLGGLVGAGMSMLGGSGGSAGLAGGVVAAVQKFGLKPSHAAMAAPLIVNFLQSRLDPSLLAKIEPVLGMLKGMGGGGAGGESAGGGIGGMLGGLLG